MKKVYLSLGCSLVVRINGQCKDCIFFDSDGKEVDCDHVLCLAEERPDCKDVIYKKIRTKQGENENEL